MAMANAEYEGFWKDLGLHVSLKDLLEAAATVALRRTQSDPDFVKAERLKRTQLMPRWQHPSPHPMGRAGE